MTDNAYLTGRLLLAMPGMGDPRFERAVIAMIAHEPKGAMGIGIGMEREGVGFHDVLHALDIAPGAAPNCPVHDGGPVEPTHGFVIHSPDWVGADTLAAGPFGAVSSSVEILKAIAAGEGPANWLFALGYAGWSEGQLDQEMRQHGWYAAKGDAQILFDHRAPDRWKATWQAEGIEPALLAHTTGTA